MNFQNPYFTPYYQPPVVQPSSVIKVNGENGARAYQMGANSSALLLDESGLMVWLVVSDGAGYKTVTPYDITPHKAAPVPDYGILESRIKRLEDMIHDSTDPSAAGKRKLDAGDDQTGKGYARINAEPTGGIDPDR